jgi:EpsI family protein
MVFAIPISALDEIGLPLRVWVTNAGERIAHLAGIDVVRSGTQLFAPDGRFNYDVAAPCSGVRSLMALMALSVLIGYLNFRSWWRRGLVFGLSVPLVYLGNVTRIVAIVFAAQAGGPAWGDRAHGVMGYGVFVIVLAGVLGAVALIRKWMPEAAEEDGDRKPETGNRKPDTGDRRLGTGNRRPETGNGGPDAGDRSDGVAALGDANESQHVEGREQPAVGTARVPDSSSRFPVSGFRSPVSLAVGCVLILVGVEMLFLHRLAQMPPRGQVGVVLGADGLNPVELPAFLGTDWIGQRAEVSAVEREILPPDTGFSRKNYAFVADRTKDVFLSIVLSGRDRTSIHRPELCLVGQGWTIDDAASQAFRFPAGSADSGREFPATVLRVRREVPTARGRMVVPQLVAYWFVAGDTVVPSHWRRFMHDAWNRVARARADRWAYVLMQTDARDGEAAALARMQAVLEGTLPVFQKPFAVAAE